MSTMATEEKLATRNILDAKHLPEPHFSSPFFNEETRKSKKKSALMSTTTSLMLMMATLVLCMAALFFLWMPDQELLFRQRHTIQKLASVMEKQHSQMEQLREQIDSLNALLKSKVPTSELLPDSEPSDLSDPCLMRVDSGPCLGSVSRFYFDFESGRCKEFSYGGCDGNANNFDNLLQCQSTCELNETVPLLDTEEDAEESESESESESEVPSACSKAASVGRCRGRIERWYFDGSVADCRKFYWGGCGGNENNFASRDKCLNVCSLKKSRSTNLCTLPPLTGPCRAHFQNYFFNASSGQCEEFVYGGCDGNANNFETMDACKNACTTQN